MMKSKKMSLILSVMAFSAIAAQDKIEHKLSNLELGMFKYIVSRGQSGCYLATEVKGQSVDPVKLIKANTCKVRGYIREKGFLSLLCTTSPFSQAIGEGEHVITYAKTEAKCWEFLSGLQNKTYDPYQPNLRPKRDADKVENNSTEKTGDQAEKIERRHSLIFSIGYGGTDKPKGYDSSAGSDGFAYGFDYWYQNSSGTTGVSLGASMRKLPYLDSSATIAGQTTKTSVTLYPIILQLRFGILQLGAGYAPASASVTINGKSAPYAGSGGAVALMAGLGWGGHVTHKFAMQFDLLRIYYYPDLGMGGYAGLGVGFAFE